MTKINDAADDIERAIDEGRYFAEFDRQAQAECRAITLAAIERAARQIAEAHTLADLEEARGDMRREREPTVIVDRAIAIKTGRAP